MVEGYGQRTTKTEKVQHLALVYHWPIPYWYSLF